MDKWLVNMAAGATLSALLVIFGARTFVDITYPSGGGSEPEPEVVAADTSAAPGAGEQQETAAETPPFSVLLASASLDSGMREARKCVACHGFDEGGPNKIGPNLYGIVGAQVAAHEGFAYSAALEEYGGVWDYDRLDCFLRNPRECVPGTKMAFAGINNDKARADLIAYMRSVSPNAPPFPEPEEAASAAPETQMAAPEAMPAPGTMTPPAEAASAPAQEAAPAEPAQN